MVAPFLPDEEKVAAIRRELVATGAGIYLDAATAGPLPSESDRAMREWADWELRVGRAGPDATSEFGARAAEARGTLAAILLAPTERVHLASGSGAAIRLAAAARRWRPGERIVAVSSLEASVLVALAELAAVAGADLERVEASPGEAPDVTVEAIAGAISRGANGAALVAVPHVSPLDGSLLPLAELADAAHRAGAWLAVDGSLALGAVPVDVGALGADVYAAAGDRWLLGPSGTAAVCLGPGLGSWAAWREDDPAAEPGTDLNRAAVIGLARSAGWLAMQVGLEWAFARARRMLELMAGLLGAIPGVKLLAPPEQVGTVTAFRVAGWPADRLREELGRRAFAVVGLVEAADALRVSIGCWNTEEEIRSFAESVGELAATSPDRLPHRPSIMVLPADRR